jgi:crotonobetainyl-CoA:carnitine CoA-transferase CaiB-like acyl-CoA transferase
LSDWGAEVIKIESLIGDAWRGFSSLRLYPFEVEIPAPFEADNRNKRSIAFNLRSEEGQRIFHRLVEGADVFVTNMAPATITKLNADYEILTEINPRLIYGVLNGYGERGPDKDLPGFDWTAYWARSGIMLTLGEPGGPPLRPRPGIGDHPTSMLFAGAICAALFCRERTGVAQKVSVALLNCGLWTLLADVSVSLATGKNVPRIGRDESANPLTLTYKTKDDKWIFICMPQADLFWSILCRALGWDDLIDDPRFENSQARVRNAKVLIKMLDEIIVTKSREEWSKIFTEHDVIFGLVQTSADLITDPQVNQFISTIEHPTYGKLKVVRSPGEFSQTPGGLRSCAPVLGQHTEEILSELGYTWEEIVKLKEQGVII